jgi:hypothetical protein
MAPQVVTLAARPDLEQRLDEITDPWPKFMNHDPVVRLWFPKLYERFREFQYALYEPERTRYSVRAAASRFGGTERSRDCLPEFECSSQGSRRPSRTSSAP